MTAVKGKVKTKITNHKFIANCPLFKNINGHRKFFYRFNPLTNYSGVLSDAYFENKKTN